MPHYFSTVLLVVFGVAANSIADDARFRLGDNDVVAFLGGTNVVNLQKAGYLEAMLTAANHDTKPLFRDMAWEGDTVFDQGTVIERWREDKFGDLGEQLTTNNISVVIAQFGQCEALSGSEKIGDFTRAYEGLLKTLRQDDRRIVILSPIPFERARPSLPDLSQHNSTLASYVAATQQLAKDNNCLFVNLFSCWNSEHPGLTDNGLHVSPSSQQTLADAILKSLGVPSIRDTGLMLLRNAVVNKHQLWMNYWRPANWKCLYGDDGLREFGKGTAGGQTLREEWSQLPAMVAEAEVRVHELAARVEVSKDD